MRKYFIATFLAVFVVIVATLIVIGSKDKQLVSPNEAFKIAKSDMDYIVKQAKSGQIEAMRKLAAHYGMYGDNYEMQSYWQFQMAEAGDVDTRRFLIESLESSKISADREKAIQLRRKWVMEDK